MEIEENLPDLTTAQKECMAMMDEVLKFAHQNGEILVNEIDRKIGNELIFHEKLKQNIPKFLGFFFDSIFKTPDINPTSFMESVLRSIKTIEHVINMNPKPSADIRRVMRNSQKSFRFKLDMNESSRPFGIIPMENVISPESALVHAFNKELNNELYVLPDPAKNSGIYEIYNFMVSKEDPNRVPYMKVFYRLPHRSTNKLFYEMTKKPISFSMIVRKIKKHEYSCAEQVYFDFKTMFKNAIAYFVNNMAIVTIAMQMYEELEKYAKNNLNLAEIAKLEKTESEKNGFPKTPENENSTPITENKSMEILNENSSILLNKIPESFSTFPESTNKTFDTSKNISLEITNLKNTESTKIDEKTPRAARISYAENSQESPINKSIRKPKSSPFVRVLKKLKKLTAKNDSRLICEDFLRLPSQELYPDYYKLISNPIDIKMIEQKVKEEQYTELEDLGMDLAQLIANARYYNKTTSQIYKDTFEMEKFIFSYITPNIKELLRNAAKNQAFFNPPPSVNTTKKDITQLFISVYKAADKNVKLFRLAGIHKQMKQLKNTIYSHTNFDEFFSLMFGMIKKNADNYRAPSKAYSASLTLLSLLVEKYNKISIETPILYPTKIEDIVDTIIFNLKNIKDIYGLFCWNSLSHSECVEEFSIGGKNFKRTITLIEIENCVQKRLYKRLGCFLNDFCSLLRRTREKYPSFSEPFVHTTIIFENLGNIVNHLDRNIYSYEPYVNWTDFVNDISFDKNSSETFGIPAISREIVENAENFTGEPIQFKQVSLFNHAKFREIIYNTGDFVSVIKNNQPQIVLIRKFFMMPSGKKGFVSHLVSSPNSLSLAHAREFADNELILMNIFGCFRVKDIIRRINIAQIYKPSAQEESNPPEFFIYSVYDHKYNTLYNIPLESNQIKNEINIPERTLISPPPLQTPPQNFITNMLLHCYSRHPHSQKRQMTEKEMDYFIYKNSIIKKGDFIQTIYDEKTRFYQIESFRVSEFDETSLLDEIQLKCLEYINFNQLKNLFINLFYPKEYIQTENRKTIILKDIQSIVCVFPESKYFSIRYPQFLEEEVYICRYKISNDQLSPVDQFEIDSAFKEEIIYIPPFKIHQNFPDEFYKEIERCKTASNESFSEKNFASRINSRKVSDLLWVCQWQDCGHTFNNFPLLFHHFKNSHKDSFKTTKNVLGSTFRCLWKECEHEDAENFKTRVNLIRHVRDDHCKIAAISLKDTKDIKIAANLNSNYEQTRIPNPINGALILLRDPFIENIFKFLEKANQNIDSKFEPLPESFNKTSDLSLQIPVESSFGDLSLKSEDILFGGKIDRIESNLSLP